MQSRHPSINAAPRFRVCILLKKSDQRRLRPTSSLQGGGSRFRAFQASPVGFLFMLTLAGSGGPICRLPYAESQLRFYQRFLRAELRRTKSTLSPAASNRKKLSFSKTVPHRCFQFLGVIYGIMLIVHLLLPGSITKAHAAAAGHLVTLFYASRRMV